MDPIPVETALAWRWRCLTEGKIVLGADLRVAQSPATTRLAEWSSPEVDRGALRCTCGGQVLPVVPIDIKA